MVNEDRVDVPREFANLVYRRRWWQSLAYKPRDQDVATYYSSGCLL